MKDLALHVTLWPSFKHFSRFLGDPRITSIRLNSAMVDSVEMDSELGIASSSMGTLFDIGVTPSSLFFDIKGRQLRITEVIPSDDHLELIINHPIKVLTPTVVLFKAGSDQALLKEVTGDGHHLIFEGGPKWKVKAGESLHIRHRSLHVGGPIFTDAEKEKIAKVMKAGFSRFYLSYVEDQQEIDELREIIGKDAFLILKIESKQGLRFVEEKYVKDDSTALMAARGDLYVEIDYPHQILAAMKLIISKDERAFAGSRMLLSIVNSPVPECADFSELAWLYDIGYRNMLLCDEICLKEELLKKAVNAFDAFRNAYVNIEPKPKYVRSLEAVEKDGIKVLKVHLKEEISER